MDSVSVEFERGIMRRAAKTVEDATQTPDHHSVKTFLRYAEQEPLDERHFLVAALKDRADLLSLEGYKDLAKQLRKDLRRLEKMPPRKPATLDPHRSPDDRRAAGVIRRE